MTSNATRLKAYLDDLGIERIVIVDDEYEGDESEKLRTIVNALEERHGEQLFQIDAEVAGSLEDLDWELENDVDLAKDEFKEALENSESHIKRKMSKVILEDEIIGNSVSRKLTEALRAQTEVELKELSPADWERDGADLLQEGKKTIFVLDYVLSQSKVVDGAALASQVSGHDATEAIIMYSSRLDDGPDTDSANELRNAVKTAVPSPSANIVYVSKAEARADPLALVCALQIDDVKEKIPAFFTKLEVALSKSGEAALDAWNKLDDRHKAQIVLQTAFSEGSDPFDVLYRVMSILARDQLHQALDDAFGGGQYAKTVDALFAKLNGMVTPVSEATRMAIKLNHLEHYEDITRINQRGLPIQPGDIFESDSGKVERNRRKFILMAQPCQAQLRPDGTRGTPANPAARWDSGYLVPIEPGAPPTTKGGRERYYEGIGAGPLHFTKIPPITESDYDQESFGCWLNFRRAIPVPFALLDLCMLDQKGRCRIERKATAVPGAVPAARAWLEANAAAFESQMDASASESLREALEALGPDASAQYADGNRPWFLGSKGKPRVEESAERFAIDVVRIGRMRLEHAQVYLTQFFAFLARQGLERPFARIPGDA